MATAKVTLKTFLAKRVPPDVVQSKDLPYNKYKGGSDLKSQMCQYYTHPHRSLKWWKRVLFALLGICLVHAIPSMHNSIPSKRPLSSLDFRVQVIDELLSTCTRSNSTPQTPETAPFSSGYYPGRNRQGQNETVLFAVREPNVNRPV